VKSFDKFTPLTWDDYGKTVALYMDICIDVLDALLKFVRFEQYSMTGGRVQLPQVSSLRIGDQAITIQHSRPTEVRTVERNVLLDVRNKYRVAHRSTSLQWCRGSPIREMPSV